MNTLRLIFRLRINEGKLEEFKQHASAIIAMVREHGHRTPDYEYFLNADESECVVLESFADSEALLAHADMVAERAVQMFAVCEIQNLWLCGNPSQAVVEKTAAFAPSRFGRWQGKAP